MVSKFKDSLVNLISPFFRLCIGVPLEEERLDAGFVVIVHDSEAGALVKEFKVGVVLHLVVL